jgi:YebC/PmpR family DNA-binding regulatory protein
MAGHNKWSKVKHIKGAVDAKRGKLFSKLAKEIAIAAKDGGGDPDLNARLRQAIIGAKSQNMPNDNIDRAIKRGTGELEGASYEEACYEGFAPGGVAILVDVVTDNRNRTVADLRSLFNKNNGTFATPGSVSHLFDRKGEIRLATRGLDEEQALEASLEAGAEDVSSDEEAHVITTAVDQLGWVADRLRILGHEVMEQKLVYLPQTAVPLKEPRVASQVLRLYRILDEHDDTQSVFSNFDISEAMLDQVSA